MPRDGSNIYHRPVGTDAVSDTTIDSAKYNANVADVEQDLNLPRPIVAGGTGASSADQALQNLLAEKSKQVITNFSSDTFVPGSFYAATTATAAPVAGHAFAGICYAADASNMVIEARDLTDPAHAKYVRIMSGGVWSAFAIGDYVQKAGDTMTGLLTLSGDPTTALQAATKQYADTKVAKAGDTMTGVLVLPGNPANPLEAAPKQYVDSAASGAAAGTVHYDLVQALTGPQLVQARQNIYAAPFDAMAYNGLQINGNNEVSQQNAQTWVPLTGATYVTDQWYGGFVRAGGGLQGAQYAIGPTGTTMALQSTAVIPAGFAAGDYVLAQTRIEGYRCKKLGWGTTYAVPVTISFWLYCGVAGTVTMGIRNNASNRTFLKDFVCAAAWNFCQVTVPPDTTGVWEIGNLAGMLINFSFGAGSSWQGVNGVWQAGGFMGTPATSQNFFAGAVGATIHITGLHVVAGSEGPTYDRLAHIMRPYDQELALCQRYYFKALQLARFAAAAANQIFGISYNLPVPMRAAPTVTGSTSGRSNVLSLTYGPIDANMIGLSLTAAAAGDAYSFGETLIADARM
ncbi:MAG TPA: hypothetical protein VHT00_14310 [Stellaceae bacterium]|jgi:hypothetical protein|nr:hypothetical protein [Stellaceae bacterium]